MHAVAREYLLVGETGSLVVVGYGGEETDDGDDVDVWYDGKMELRRSVVRIRNGLLDFVGVMG